MIARRVATEGLGGGLVALAIATLGWLPLADTAIGGATPGSTASIRVPVSAPVVTAPHTVARIAGGPETTIELRSAAARPALRYATTVALTAGPASVLLRTVTPAATSCRASAPARTMPRLAQRQSAPRVEAPSSDAGTGTAPGTTIRRT